MSRGTRSAFRTPLVTAVLAAVLGVSVLAATELGAAAAAARSGGEPVAAAAAPTVPAELTHPGAAHGFAPPTKVLGAAGSRRQARRRALHVRWSPASLLVAVPSRGIAAHRNPWSSSPVIGTVASSSKYYHVPLVIWADDTNRRGTWGRVELPYVWPRRDGWIPLAGLRREQTFAHVDVDLSEHRLVLYKGDRKLFSVPAAIGASWSPTPPGHYVVTDRVPFAPGSSLGSFAFGISGIQPHLPAGWTGGNQLAIHGTNNPSSIGTSASAGCVRVSEWALAHLKPYLRLGTPVVIHR